MNKSKLVLQLHKLQDEKLNFEEIQAGTQGGTAHFQDILEEIQSEIDEVTAQLKAIWRAEKAQEAQELRKVAA